MTALVAFLVGVPLLLISVGIVVLHFARRAAAEIDGHGASPTGKVSPVRSPAVERIIRQHREHRAGVS